MEESVEVREIMTVIRSSLLYYEVLFQDSYYILDPELRLCCITNKATQQSHHAWVCKEYRTPPRSIHFDRLKVEHPELSSAIRKSYLSHLFEQQKPLHELVKMGVIPEEVGYYDTSTIMGDLQNLYWNCTRNNFDLSLRWIYHLLRIRNKEKCRLYETYTPNPLLSILYWKDCIYDRYYLDWFSHLKGGERKGLMQVALARNRPKGENVFAQFPKDLLHLIFEWVQWSLPLNLNIITTE